MPENPIPTPNQILGQQNNNKGVPNPNDILKPISKLAVRDESVQVPTYKNLQDLQVDNAINFIKEKGGRNGSTILDHELETLRNVLGNPSATKEQREKAILTIQGYDPKHSDDNTMYYNKMDDNGVYMPTALGYGEKPPKGYKVPSIWGSQEDANDDKWYTDLGKSIANGVLGAAEGAINLAQVGTTLTTGEESDYLNKLVNTANVLKFEKDIDLATPIYNTEGIQSFGDLVDKDRFDLSLKSLWGTLNMAAESLTSFYGGAKGANVILNSPKAAVFTGSFMSQLGDNLDNAEAAGLKGRDKASVASVITAPMALLDTFFGLDGKIMSNAFKDAKKELIKNAVKSVEKDASGNITEAGFKELAKITTAGYGQLAKNSAKEVVKDAIEEGTQEAAQDFVQKSGEQLWDKLSDEDKGKFGTDAFDAKSFGSYIQSLGAGLASGAPMSLLNKVVKYKNKEQTNNAYERIKQGPEAVQALKTDLANSLKNNEITQAEYDNANFKINAYQNYHDLTQKYNMNPEDEKRAFELSFQIEGLNTEIPTDKQEIHRMQPIEKGEVKAKEIQRNKLQEELDQIILKNQVKTEPVVAKKVEDAIKSEEEKAIPKIKTEEVVSEETEIPESTLTQKTEVIKPVRRKLEETPREEFNQMTSLVKKQTVQEHLKDKPDMSMTGKIIIEQNGKHAVDLGGGKYVTLASSVEGGTKPSPIKRENLPTESKIENKYFLNEGRIEEGVSLNKQGKANMPVTSYEAPVIVKREEIDAYNYDPKTGEESPALKDGKPVKKAILNVYNGQTGKYIISVREKDKTGFKAYKSSVYSPSEIKQMEAIQERGVTPLIESDERFTKPSVEEQVTDFTEKISEGEQLNTPEDLQFYENNKEAIEAKLQENARLINQVSKEEKPENTEVKPTEKLKKEAKIEKPIEKEPEVKAEKVETTSQTIERLKREGYEEFEIERAVDEANRIMALNNSDFTKEMNDKAMFASTGQVGEYRIDTRGLSTEQVKSAIKNIIAGKKEDSVAVKTFTREVINKIKKTGNVPLISGTGGMSATYDMPLYEFFLEKGLGEREITPTEEEEFKTELAYKETKNLKQKVSKFKERAVSAKEKSDKVNKIVDSLQAKMPNVKFKLDDSIEGAGLWNPNTNTISVNPEYSGFDTPIHEAGHVLIDAIGYNNKVIQKAVTQLKDTDLYKETKERYPELSDRDLDIEVLSEAIGREGADVFDKVEDKNTFMQYLDYIFDWLKTKLGLNKNIAKSLAKQIISGISTKDLKATKETTIREQKLKPGEKVKTYAVFREYLGREYYQEQEDIENAEYVLESETSTEAEQLEAQKVINDIKKQRKTDSKAYREYIKSLSENLSEYENEELIDLYNQLKVLDLKNYDAKDLMLNIAMRSRRERQNELKDFDGYLESIADKKDIGDLDVWFLNMSHFTEHQPEVQQMIKGVQNAQLNMVKEASELKSTNEALAKRVIEEENKRLGISGKAASLMSSDSAKYFEWMDNGEGGLITMDQAKSKGYSKAKLDYLDFTRNLLADRRNMMEANDYQNADMDVLRVDKKFMESFKTDGLAQAFSYYLGGGGANLGEVRIMYNGEPKAFKDIEKDIISKVKKNDPLSNIRALIDLLRYNFAARKQLKRGFNVDEKVNPLQVKGNAQYSLNNNGVLVSRFDKPRNKDRGYSKDFYRAMVEFIDDTAHVKHINPMLSVIDSVEYLNKNGYLEKGINPKPNVAKWIEEWKKLHIFKEAHVNDPTLDATIKFFRQLTAATTMWFNIPANAINVFVGNYNNWRQENSETVGKGNARLFLKSGPRKYGVNQYALDILEKYNVVNRDFDSNPKIGFGKIFDKLATIGTQIGEYQIQGSLALGLMNEKDFNSFEYKKDKYGVKKLVIKDTLTEKEKKELEDRMIGIKNRVTDIQGKYPDADRRNIMRGEVGKAVFQFKVWMPDWFKERFGARYINSRNQIREGSFNGLVKEGFKQLKEDVNKKGLTKGLYENKAFMSNLKGLMAITSLMIWKYQDDDDESKRRKATMAENTLGQLMFITDPEQLKYTLSNPVASLGKMKDFVNAAEALVTLETNAKGEFTADEKIKRVLPANKVANIVETVSEITE